MDIVREAAIVAVFVGIQAAADFHVLLDDHDLLAALGQIRGTDHAVVPGTNHHAVVFKNFGHGFIDLNGLNVLNYLNGLNSGVVQIVPIVQAVQNVSLKNYNLKSSLNICQQL